MQLTRALFLVSLLLSGCATTGGYETVLQSWVGDTTDHLVSVWGVPQQEYRQDNGGKVLEYVHSGQFVVPGATTYQPVTTSTRGTLSTYGSNGVDANGTYNGTSTTYAPHTSAPTVFSQRCVTRFTSDANGRITRWAWQGNSCRSVAPKKRAETALKPVPVPVYQKCTADQLRRGECS
jgi:hypothetical protein